MTNRVTVPRALGIKCPFTGDVLDVYLTVAGGMVLYNCPKAFTLAEPVSDLAWLQDRASMRNGVHGLADGVSKPTCPYTGERLMLRVLPDGRYMYAGGFNPRKALADLDEFLYYLTMRNGVATRKPPAKPAPVESVQGDPPRREDACTEPSDATLEAMEGVAAAHMSRGTVVSMSMSGRGKRGGKGK